MTITSKQIFRAISHYQETNGVANQIEERNVEFLIEAMRTGQDNNYVLIEEIKGLGKGFYVKGHGCYFPNNDSGSVTFVLNLGY